MLRAEISSSPDISRGSKLSLIACRRQFSSYLNRIIASIGATMDSNLSITLRGGMLIGIEFKASRLIEPNTVPSPLKTSNCRRRTNIV